MTNTRSAAPRDLELGREFARRLREQCDQHGCAITLFGSRASGGADEESDLDLFVALRGADPNGEVKAAARRLACDLTLEHGILVSVFVADREFLERHKGYSLLETIEEEGLRL